jgi:hypothetical protein
VCAQGSGGEYERCGQRGVEVVQGAAGHVVEVEGGLRGAPLRALDR